MKDELLKQPPLPKTIQIPQLQSSNTSLIIQFRRVCHLVQNNASADKSRKCARIKKGLNPDIPRPVHGNRPPPKNQKQQTGRKANKKAEQISKMDEHKIAIQQLCYRFGTNIQTGLTTQQAIKKNAQQGDNKFSQKKRKPSWLLFIRQLIDWFPLMLWLASLLCFVIYGVYPIGNLHYFWLGILIICIILVTCAFSYIQHPKPQPLMQRYKDTLPSVCKVLRDEKITQIHATKLVRGDIVDINQGQIIPADIRIINCIQMKIDSSVLTGQNNLVLVNPSCTHPDHPLQTKNLVFFGTLCKEGKGRGIVIRIAEKTIMGQIAEVVSEEKTQKSPLRVELDKFVFLITIFTICISVIFYFIALFVIKYSALDCLVLGIGIILSNVPEGLLTCITISLIIVSKKLLQKNMKIKNLQSLVTLGLTTCICSNKTGIFTQQIMNIQHLWYDAQVKTANTNNINQQSQYNANDPSFKILHHAALITSELQFSLEQSQKQSSDIKSSISSPKFDTFQTALAKFYQPIEDIHQTQSLYPFAKNKNGFDSKMPFNSYCKYSLCIVQQQGPNHHYVVYIKGAPQKIWSYCSKILHEGKHKAITAQQKQNFEAINDQLGKNGERVLGFAMLPLPKDPYHKGYEFSTSSPDSYNFPLQNYIFIGLISFKNLPKQNIIASVQKCKLAGIKVVMITGDQSQISTSIAKQIGIIQQKTNQDLQDQGFTHQQALRIANAIVIHGDMITKAYQQGNQQGEKKLTNWAKKPQIIFARTTPSQKLLIVKAFQSIGNVVTFIGDDINDSPSINQSDIGISLNASASTITKDTSDIILLTDDFTSVVYGIEEGRRMLDNFQKIIVYLLTSNMAEIWPFIAFVVIQIPLPLSNIFMLCICVGTDIYPAIALAYEQSETGIMTRKPYKIEQHLITARLLVHAYGNMGQIATCGGFFTYFVVMRLYGFPPNILVGLLSRPAIVPNNDTTYNVDNCEFDQLAPNLGCAGFLLPCQQYNLVRTNAFPNWLSTLNNRVDLRGVYSTCGDDGFYVPQFVFPIDVLNTISPISNHRVAYTTQSIFYAQSAYFVTIIMVQWSSIFACKSRKISIIHTKFNKHIFGGIFLQSIIFIILLYIPGVNLLFGGRPLTFFLLGIPGLGFSILLLIWEQSRKFLINLDNNGGKPNWWERNLLW